MNNHIWQTLLNLEINVGGECTRRVGANIVVLSLDDGKNVMLKNQDGESRNRSICVWEKNIVMNMIFSNPLLIHGGDGHLEMYSWVFLENLRQQMARRLIHKNLMDEGSRQNNGRKYMKRNRYLWEECRKMAMFKGKQEWTKEICRRK